MNRKDALAAGEKFFEITKACKHCGGYRRSASNACCPCYNRKYHNTLTGRVAALLRDARKRAKNKGQLFQLTKDFVYSAVEKGVCAKTGIPFALVSGMGRHPFGPSVDKINPEFPYSDYNVQVVCNVYQLAKNEFTDEDVLTMAKALVQNNGYALIKKEAA